MKGNINRLEDELEKLGYTIEGKENYMLVEAAFYQQLYRMFWEGIELLQGYDDNQLIENFAEFLDDNRWVKKNE